MSKTARDVIAEWLAAGVPGGNTADNLMFCLHTGGFVVVPRPAKTLPVTERQCEQATEQVSVAIKGLNAALRLANEAGLHVTIDHISTHSVGRRFELRIYRAEVLRPLT